MIVRASPTHPNAQLMERAQAVKGRSLLADLLYGVLDPRVRYD